MQYNKAEILKELRIKAGEFRLSTPDSMEFRALKCELWKVQHPATVWYECTQENAEKIIESGFKEPIIRCYPSPYIALGNRSFFYQSRIVWLRIELGSLNLVNLYTIPYTPGDWSILQERASWEMDNFPSDIDGWYRPDDVVVLRSDVAWNNWDKIIHGSKNKF